VESELTHAKLFFLASDLVAGDVAGQLALLACGLPRDRFAVTVGVLDRADSSAADALRAAGLSVVPLPIRHPLDFSGMRKLRSAVRGANPAVLHCFGPAAVRAARLAVSGRADGGNTPRLVASAVTSTGGGVGGWLSGRVLRRADRVLATSRAEGERYRRLGVRGERLTRVNPAVALPPEAPDRHAFCSEVSVPPDSKLIFAAGRLDAAHGVKEAVIAFDMLRYESSALRLVLTGDGPNRVEAEELGRALAFDDFRIHFSGARPDLPAAAQLAEMVWVTCASGGELLALRAMAAGRPVIAYHTPELAEVIDDGITGYLVPVGDRAAIATKAHELLVDPALAAKMGEAGRARAAERFSVARMVEQHVRVYQELVG
jgi:glycosyltransferase involved in cell wall biosynthesis